MRDETFVLNLGPQHPATHGVLRVKLTMDGEYIVLAEPVLGYIHRMHEKMAENRHLGPVHAQHRPHGLPPRPGLTTTAMLVVERAAGYRGAGAGGIHPGDHGPN
jgi:hypothetical protein